jgi:integrase
MAKRVRGQGSVRFRHGRWEARLQIAGHGRLTKSFERETDAWAWISTVKADALRGVLKVEAKRRELRFDDLCRLYRVHMAPRWRPGMAAYFDCHIKGVLLPAFGARAIASLTAREIQTFLDARLKAVSGSTVNKYHQILSATLNYAVRMGDLPFSPMTAVERARAVPKGARPLRLNEIQAFFRACRPEDLPFFTILFFCGLRRSEIFRMAWTWVDLDREMLHILVAKCGSSEIPMTRAVKNAFLELGAARDGFVFPGHHRDQKGANPMDPSKPLTAKRKSLTSTLKRAGIDPNRVSLHSFRHSFTTLLEECGTAYGVMRALGRWGKVGRDITARYLHPTDAQLRSALSRLEALVLEGGGVSVLREACDDYLAYGTAELPFERVRLFPAYTEDN